MLQYSSWIHCAMDVFERKWSRILMLKVILKMLLSFKCICNRPTTQKDDGNYCKALPFEKNAYENNLFDYDELIY